MEGGGSPSVAAAVWRCVLSSEIPRRKREVLSAGELPYKSLFDAGLDGRGVASPLILIPGGASPPRLTGLALGCSGCVGTAYAVDNHITGSHC